MILKNFINLFNIYYIFFFLLFIFLISKFIILSNIRYKFLLLIIILFLFICIGLYYCLDGIIMLFIVSELSILLIFITMFSQLYSYNKEKNYINFYILAAIILFVLNYSFYSLEIINYNSYYSYYSININDFYYIYNYYFEKQILTTILITLIITTFSIFFILLYFSLKNNQLKEFKKKKNLNLLRKQNTIRQSNYRTKIRIFDKI